MTSVEADYEAWRKERNLPFNPQVAASFEVFAWYNGAAIWEFPLNEGGHFPCSTHSPA